MCKHALSINVLDSDRLACKEGNLESSTRPELSSSIESRDDFKLFHEVFSPPLNMPEACVCDQDLMPVGPTQTAPQQKAASRRLFHSGTDSTFSHRPPSVIVPATPVSCCFGGFPLQPSTPELSMECIRREVPERSMQEWFNDMELVSAPGSCIKSRVVEPGTQLPLPPGCHKGDLPKPAFVLLGLLN